MYRFLLAVLFALWALPTWAQAPTTAPSAKVFEGPTIGERWEPSAAFIGGINTQVGTTYTILTTDIGKLITFNNGSPVAVTLPVATTAGFEAYKRFFILNLGAGTVTVTPTTSTINGGATKTYAQNASGTIVSNGTNYLAY